MMENSAFCNARRVIRRQQLDSPGMPRRSLAGTPQSGQDWFEIEGYLANVGLNISNVVSCCRRFSLFVFAVYLCYGDGVKPSKALAEDSRQRCSFARFISQAWAPLETLGDHSEVQKWDDRTRIKITLLFQNTGLSPESEIVQALLLKQRINEMLLRTHYGVEYVSKGRTNYIIEITNMADVDLKAGLTNLQNFFIKSIPDQADKNLSRLDLSHMATKVQKDGGCSSVSMVSGSTIVSAYSLIRTNSSVQCIDAAIAEALGAWRAHEFQDTLANDKELDEASKKPLLLEAVAQLYKTDIRAGLTARQASEKIEAACQ